MGCRERHHNGDFFADETLVAPLWGQGRVASAGVSTFWTAPQAIAACPQAAIEDEESSLVRRLTRLTGALRFSLRRRAELAICPIICSPRLTGTARQLVKHLESEVSVRSDLKLVRTTPDSEDIPAIRGTLGHLSGKLVMFFELVQGGEVARQTTVVIEEEHGDISGAARSAIEKLLPA